MWRVSLICEGIYGVSADQNLEDTWNANLLVNVRENQVDIQANIYTTYISEMGEYDGLMDTIRYFAKAVKNKQNKELCTIQFHCQGISCFVGENPLEIFQDENGIELIDATFYEEIV